MAAKPIKHLKGSNFDTTYSFENDEGEEFEFEIEAIVAEYHPAKLSGPPEDCYPAEGGDCEDWLIFYNDKVISDKDFVAMGGNIDKMREAVEQAAAEWEPDEPPERDDFDRYFDR